MTRRYYVPDLPLQGGRVDLSAEEAAHAARVMRVAVGDAAILFDGQGRQADGVFCEVGKKKVVIEAQPSQRQEFDHSIHVHVAVSLPKGDRAKWLVEKLTELGVRTLLPVDSQFMQGTHGHNESNLEKLRRVVVEACKQSGHNRLLSIESKRSLQQFCCLPLVEESAGSVYRLLADPRATVSLGDLVDQSKQVANPDRSFPVTDWWILIGPEGGFAEEEMQLAVQHGWTPVRLGDSILRIETAAMAMASRIIFC